MKDRSHLSSFIFLGFILLAELLSLVIFFPVDGYGVFLAQPAAEVDAPAPVAAKRQGRRLRGIEALSADRTVDQSHT